MKRAKLFLTDNEVLFLQTNMIPLLQDLKVSESSTFQRQEQIMSFIEKIKNV